ncbi:MAG: hypothetical protein AAGA91_01740 [Pseudomonadota bacterium]
MKHTFQSLIGLCALAATMLCQADQADTLPSWEALEFEERAFWATANSRLSVDTSRDDEWRLQAISSVVGNSEDVTLRFDPVSGEVVSRSRVSKGKQQRLKHYEYATDYVHRERRNPDSKAKTPPQEWQLVSTREVPYPDSKGNRVVTASYLLPLLAQRLQNSEPGTTAEYVVHTDLNFYRVQLTSGNGVPIEVDYQIDGGERVRGTRQTRAVSVTIQPEGQLADKDDFSLMGLSGEIILFFDRETGLPLQVRGRAPRIGNTGINLKSATLRAPTA